MLKITSNTYKDIIQESWKNRMPFMCYGGPGIGKSEMPRQEFKKIANQLNTTFVEWNLLSRDDKAKILDNPEKYFVFTDQRVAQMDSTDLRGIPNMLNDKMLQTIPLDWIVHFTNPKALGCIFFDEINLAPPVVAGQCYQIILNRSISDRKIGDNVIIFGAGNRAEDKAYTFEMSLPLRDRFSEFELVVDLDSWVDWAISAKINPHLISFIRWKPSYLYNIEKIRNSSEKASTPRGVERASKHINDKDISSNFVHTLISISCGEAFATEFQAYVKYYLELEWKHILENPESVANFSIDKNWAVSGGLAELYTRNKTDKKLFEKILAVIDNLKPEFGIVTFRYMKEYDPENFSTLVMKSANFSKISKKVAHYFFITKEEAEKK